MIGDLLHEMKQGAKAEALREAAADLRKVGRAGHTADWLEARADRIEAGQPAPAPRTVTCIDADPTLAP